MRISRCKDIDLINELDRRCFPADEPLTVSNLHDAEWWVAREGGVEVGFVGVLCGFLLRYGVVLEAQNKGIGRKLVRVAYKHYAGHGLPLDTYVVATNIPSLRVFLAEGWVPTKASTDEFATYLHLAKGPR